MSAIFEPAWKEPSQRVTEGDFERLIDEDGLAA
jgi:hypothetical protein